MTKKYGTTKSLGQKDVNDKFYTKPEIVETVVNIIDNLSEYDLIIEPAAGSGAFLDFLPKDKTVGYDIAPADPRIIKADFLTLDTNFTAQHILTIGNPPFGTNGEKALQFFLKATDYSETIAFILPRSFRKDSWLSRLPDNWHLRDMTRFTGDARGLVLPGAGFTLSNEPYRLPTVFQIWDKKDFPRQKPTRKTTTALFDFVCRDDADIRVGRVGGRAGQASQDLDRAESSNYFLRLQVDVPPAEFVQFINNLSFPTIEDTVGPRSLSKAEFIEVVEESWQARKAR